MGQERWGTLVGQGRVLTAPSLCESVSGQLRIDICKYTQLGRTNNTIHVGPRACLVGIVRSAASARVRSRPRQ